MGNLVETSGQPPGVPSFVELEPVIKTLAAARESVAVATSPSQELLDQLNAAIGLVARCKKDLAAGFEPVSTGMLAIYLGLLIKAIPSDREMDARVFGRFLREDLMSLAPPIAAVDMACRRWRRKSKFLPAISEMMDEVRSATSEVRGTSEFIDRLPALRDRMVRELGN